MTGSAPGNWPGWWTGRPLVRQAGLRLQAREERSGAREPMQRLYTLWPEHADDLRADIGDEAEALIQRATQMGPGLAAIRKVLVVAELPG